MTCTRCSSTYTISSGEARVIAALGYGTPTYCPRCSTQIRLAWRNERFFYASTCANCKKPIVSIYSSDKPYVVYCNDCWWSDQFDALEYGQDYDPKRSFFDQMNELLHKVPLVNLMFSTSENCDYTNFSVGNKNCYLIAASDYNENCLYSSYLFKCKDSVDCLFSNNCEASYELTDCDGCYGSGYLQNCRKCNDCWYGYDCRGCTNCFGCVGLRNKQYHIFNEAYSPEDYERKVAELKTKPQEVQQRLEKLILKHPRRFSMNVNTENSSGDFLTNCVDCVESFDLLESVNASHCCLGLKSKDVARSIGATAGELQYECVAAPEDYHVACSALIWPRSTNLDYCLFSRTSNDCFGCVSQRNNQYCILNKQYSKSEYEQLRAKIIVDMKTSGEYGQFFPMEMTPYAYNETAAQDYYPLTKEQLQQQGLRYKEPEPISTSQGDNVHNCSQCGRAFKFVAAELAFYSQHHLLEPKQCHNCRHTARLAKRNPRQLWQRQCMCTQTDHGHHGRCSTEFSTTYAPDRKELVYCESCYQKEVY